MLGGYVSTRNGWMHLIYRNNHAVNAPSVREMLNNQARTYSTVSSPGNYMTPWTKTTRLKRDQETLD